MIRLLQSILNKLYYFIMPFLWFIVYMRHKSSDKKILFVIQNTVSADYAVLIIKLLKNEKNINMYFSNDKLYDQYFDALSIYNRVNISYINIVKSICMYWDLIIYVNHPWDMALWFPPFIKKIYINHGICTGKINNKYGEDGVFGEHRTIRPFFYPYYDIIFSSSIFEKNYAIKATPKLSNRIKVTGFLYADILESKNNNFNKEKIKKKYKIENNKKIISIISTWGKYSLYQTLGEEILNEALKMKNEYNIVFSLHPRHDEFGDIKNRKRQDIYKKYKRLGIIVDAMLWDEIILISDVAITDHTSMSLYFILLDKPVVFIPIDRSAFVVGSLFDKLYTTCISIDSPEQIKSLIKELIKINFKYNNHIKSMIRDYPGLAHKIYKQEILNLL